MSPDYVVASLIYPVSLWICMSGLDELFIDFWFAYYATFGRDSWDLSMKKLDAAPEKGIAVFVPLWKEDRVIEDMIDHNIAAIDYRDYDIYLGVYPNDPRTMEKAVLLEERYPRVRKSVCPVDGPTNKADCLNWIYQRMELEEEERGRRYEVVVQHDAEDIIHPKALKLINQLTAQYDMVQIPVLPLEMPLKFLTHGTYCDEFAEYQVKDIYTRQSMGGFVPSAGVGTAFRRETLAELAHIYRNQIYNVSTLTEDYEIGLKFKLHGKSQFLVRKALPRNGNGNGNGHGNGHKKVEYIATREYFPASFRNAVRQKSRWVMGVSLQTWERRGWQGPLRQVYWYWRDRKGLVGNVVTMVSNFIFLYCLLMWSGARLFDTGWTLAQVFPPAGIIWWLLPFNTLFIFERLFYRVYAAHKIYGPKQAAGALLRTPWANLINFASTIHALKTFFLAKLLRVEVKWAKTAHAFPTREQLMEYKRRLGELLLENRLVSAPQLERALEAQGRTGERLGEALIRLGYLTEREFTRMLGKQQNIEVHEVDPARIDLAALRKLPREAAVAHGVLPIAMLKDDTLLVASPDLITAERLASLRRATGMQIVTVLTTQSDFASALSTAYQRLRP